MLASGVDHSIVDEFVIGLNQAPSAVYAIDVGDDEDIATSRMMGTLHDTMPRIISRSLA